MPAYDSNFFRPPAPVALVTVRSWSLGEEATNVPMILDSGADISLVPRSAIVGLTGATSEAPTYELEAFDGTRSLATAIDLELQFLNKTFRGQFLLADGDHGILGRNILNSLTLLFDGPRLTWSEQR
jgi:hypothetical protein